VRGTIEWKAFETVLIARAWEDEAFRETLLRDPRAAIEQAGLRLPENVDLRVVEKAPGMQLEQEVGVHTLVLPAKP
jgi:hypothetical protein